MSREPVNTHARQARLVAEARSSGERIAIGDLPAGASLVNVLGVDYVHTSDPEVGDLYLTSVGYAYAEHLQPRNWYDLEWFRAKRVKLPGTSLVYRSPTKPVDDMSLDLVVKFSRVGEKVPIDTELIENLLCCEFNGPFEEFALAEELRHSRRGPAGLSIRTQLPLAIFVPPGETQPSQSGRFQWRIARKLDLHPGVAIDILRQYIVVYRWIPGLDAWQAHDADLIDETEARRLNARATADMQAKGFRVLDMKPQHVIVQPTEEGGLLRENDDTWYGLIDFELMERTPEYYQEIQAAQGTTYRKRRRDLIAGEVDDTVALPANLQPSHIQGVPYVHGRAESTGGLLWVVGGAPDVFDFFLPERWRTTPQIRLTDGHETYFTTSKDKIPFVWKVSRVGEPPAAAAFGVAGFRALAHGFNSPFEEAAAAWWLRHRGIPAILPRAVYRTGHRSELDESHFDPSRYRSHEHLRTLEGGPVLDPRRNYITIWDFWSGPEAQEADDEAPVARSMNVAQALARGLLDEDGARSLVADLEGRLEAAGVEVIRFLPEHVLVAVGSDQALVHDGDGRPASCLCVFRYLSLPEAPAGPAV